MPVLFPSFGWMRWRICAWWFEVESGDDGLVVREMISYVVMIDFTYLNYVIHCVIDPYEVNGCPLGVYGSQSKSGQAYRGA